MNDGKSEIMIVRGTNRSIVDDFENKDVDGEEFSSHFW